MCRDLVFALGFVRDVSLRQFPHLEFPNGLRSEDLGISLAKEFKSVLRSELGLLLTPLLLLLLLLLLLGLLLLLLLPAAIGA